METKYTFDDVLIVPKSSDIVPQNVNLNTYLTKKIKLCVPIISAAMDTVTESNMAIAIAKEGGLGIIHRNLSIEDQVKEVRTVKNYKITKLENSKSITQNTTIDKSGNLMVGATIGFYGDALDRAKSLIDAGVDVIIIDTAHGDTKAMLNIIEKIKPLNIQIIAGNIATASGAKNLISAGVDAIKVGIGPGSICTTRIIAGVGVPQISAINDVYKETQKSGIPVIADGGIRSSGDVSKAIVAGANLVMLGKILAGCTQSPGKFISINGKQYKQYRGMGSIDVLNSKNSHSKDRYFHLNDTNPVAEGVEAGVIYTGDVHNVVHQIVGGIKQTMFYVGAKTIPELQKRGEFIKITSAGLKESHPHDIYAINKTPNYTFNNI
jgi:IMP dehydrogenase